MFIFLRKFSSSFPVKFSGKRMGFPFRELFFVDFIKKAREAIGRGEFDKALDYLKQVSFDAVPLKEKPEIHLLISVSLYETGQVKQAILEAKEALRLDPHFAPAYDALGNFLLNEGKLQAAMGRYRYATRVNPGLWFPYYHWGTVLKKMGNLRAAYRKFKEAISKNPDDLEVFLDAGDCAFQLNLLQEALKFYQIFLTRGGGAAAVFPRIGNAYLLLGNHEKAVEAYKQSIALAPEEGSGYEHWGLLLQKEGKLKEAEEKYKEGLYHAPDFPTLLFRLGELLVEKGKPEEAVKPLEKALGIFLEKDREEWGVQWNFILAECAYQLGYAYRKLTETDKAKKQFAIALRFSPNHLKALEQIAELRGIYREHHVSWEFVVEGDVQNSQDDNVKGLRAYRVAALTIEEAKEYVLSCEEEIKEPLKLRDITRSGQVACYAGVLDRGPLLFLRYRDELL
jgi:tetratricopeptide (TPR) repeat protein